MQVFVSRAFPDKGAAEFMLAGVEGQITCCRRFRKNLRGQLTREPFEAIRRIRRTTAGASASVPHRPTLQDWVYIFSLQVCY